MVNESTVNKTRRFTLDYQSRKCAKYWQSVLRFGLPFVILYRLGDYIAFRIAMKNSGLRYPWPPETIIVDLAVVFFVGLLWWAYARQLVSAKRKSQAGSS